MIRFVKTAIYLGVQQLFLIRRAISSGTLNPESTHDSFRQHLPFMFVGRADWRSDAGRQVTDKAQVPKPK